MRHLTTGGSGGRQFRDCYETRRFSHGVCTGFLFICPHSVTTKVRRPMMRFCMALLAGFCLFLLTATGDARAQSADDIVWVQIEAQPSLAEATERARAYAAELEDVSGFALGSGWYGIAVGPYRRDDARIVLRTYRRDGLVPRDSFIQQSDRFLQQFWPVGANVLNRGVIEPPASVDTPEPTETAQAAETAEETPVTEATPQPPADETPTEAQQGERTLDPQERRDIQIALKWAGFYDAGIDGAFGRGTRNAMAAWQDANGYTQTGILTTRQRAALLKQYNAVLDGLDMGPVRDDRAGIEIVMPRAEVALDGYEPPFARYDSTGNLGVQVLLISQPGDQDVLYGLYDIMQTLEIVPTEGPRSRDGNSFELVGENGSIVSQTQVSLENGQIKGFTLVWPAGDEDRRRRVIAEMSKSFTRVPGVLDPTAGNPENQAIDLVAGLKIRQPKVARSGFFVDGSGIVATTAEAVGSCGRLTLDDDTEADVIATDQATGLALLKPRKPLAPLSVAEFSTSVPRLQSEVIVAGYPYQGVLSAAAMTYGTLADLRGLQGEENLTRLTLKAQPGDAGGPVLDDRGDVLGMLLPKPDGPQKLPEDVSFALDREEIARAMEAAGVARTASDAGGSLRERDLALHAQNMTVLVSCWE